MVTDRGNAGGVARQQRPRGVCLVRIEAQAASVLITVIQNPDIESRHTEVTSSFSEVDRAVDAVREFLVRFTADGQDTP